MADSDDDTEHRRTRDKFRRERSDLDNRHRPGDKREPFDDRAGGGYPNGNRSSRPDRRGPSDYRSFGGPRDRPSLGGDLPLKRPRRDWNEDHHFNRQRDARKDQAEDEASYRPPLMPFKRFLDPLDDFITAEEAIAKFKEYKASFNKRYIEEFFEAHKDEEWLREKYHPDQIGNTREQMAKYIRQRLDVFLDLFDKGMIDNQPVDMANCRNLVKLMDAVVIKLNGGTDDDLDALDQPESDSDTEMSDHKSPIRKSPRRHGHGAARSEEGEDSDFDSEDERLPTSASRNHQRSKPDNAKPEAITSPDTFKEASAGVGDWGTAVSSSSSVSGKEDEKQQPENDKDEKKERSGVEDEEDEDYDKGDDDSNHKTPNSEDKEQADDEEKQEQQQAQDTSGSPVDDQKTPQNGVKPGENASAAPVEEPSLPMETDTPVKPETAPPLCNLHKTLSIFFRCLPPTITRGELEDLCRAQPGFIRLAIYDPMPERRFTRHAWATYSPSVNIKKICWALNTSPLLREKWQQQQSGGELCATVNRDLAQRLRPVASAAALTRHRPVMRNDLRVASRLIAQLDTKHNLWPLPGQQDGGEEDVEEAVTSACPVPGLTGVLSANPLMRNLTDFLVDVTSSEEEAILSSNITTAGDNGTNTSIMMTEGVPIDRDESLLRALDRLIIYLRIVYSIDYYSATRYQLEDLMPHRCGIFHVRGNLPSTGGDKQEQQQPMVTKREVNEYLKNFNEKISNLLEMPSDLNDEEIAALGARDPEKAGEDFIEANIQKKASKKKPYKVVWVCPLSDKKFREPVFVRKHILNKHMDKIEAAKKDNAIFFNNFLRDPKRPSLPEAPRHLIHRYYPPPIGGSGSGANAPGDAADYRSGGLGSRPRNNLGGGGGFRPGGGAGGFRGGGYNNNRGSYGRRDYYGGDQPSLYPSHPGGDMYCGGGRGGSPRGYNDLGNRKRPFPGADRHRPTGGRGVISYNDLDDPTNNGY